MKLGWAVKWVGEGVPGVYRAARAAGLGRRDALRVLEASAYALAIARQRYPRRWRAENADAALRLAGVARRRRTGARSPRRSAARTSGSATRRPPTARRPREQPDRSGVRRGARASRSVRTAMRPALSALADEAGRLWDSGQLSRAPRTPRAPTPPAGARSPGAPGRCPRNLLQAAGRSGRRAAARRGRRPGRRRWRCSRPRGTSAGPESVRVTEAGDVAELVDDDRPARVGSGEPGRARGTCCRAPGRSG